MASNALVVGAGDGISASFARALARDGFKVGLVARRTDKLAALNEEIGGAVFACDAAEPGQVARLFEEVDHQLGALDVVHLQRELPDARAAGRPRSGGGAEVADGQRLRRLSGGTAGGAADAGPGFRRDPVHGRLGERQGLCEVGIVRDGQVRPARPRAEHGARVGANRTSTSRIS